MCPVRVRGFPLLAEAFGFDVAHSFIFAFVAFAFGAIMKKSSPRRMPRSSPPAFSLGAVRFQVSRSSL